MSKSVAPELRDYLRTKFAEPSALDTFNQYAPNAPGMPAQTPSLAGLTREEIAAAGTGQPKTIGEKYNPFTPEGRDRILDWGLNTDTAKAISDYGRDTWEYAQKNPLSRFVYNAPGAVAVATEAATNPTNADRPVSAAIEAVANAGKPAPTASISAPPATPDTTTGGKQTSIFPLDNTTAYGLSGAGAGALLGAAMSRKGKRGRNALLGAGLGGGAGLLAQYLMSQPGQQKTSMHTKSATNMLHDALGTGAGGAVIGSLYGALTARKKKLLRSTLRGALIGGGTGASMGAGMAAFGNPVGPTTDNPAAAEHAGFNRGFGSAAAGGLGAALSQRLADEYLPLEDEEEKTSGLFYRDLKEPSAISAETDFGYGLSAMKKQDPRFLTSFFSNTRNDVNRALNQTVSDNPNNYDTHISELIGRQLVKNNPERYALPTHEDHLREFIRSLDGEPEPKTKEDLQRMRTRYAPMQSPHYLDEKRRAEFNHIFKTMLSDKYLPKNKQANVIKRQKKAWSDNQPGGMYGNTKWWGALGAGLGGGVGGVYGAFNPGETKDKKQRSRLMGALRGLAAGGAIGGGAGAGVGLGLDAVYEPRIEFMPGVSVDLDTIDSNMKRLEESAKRVGDAAEPYAKRVGEGVKKLDETVTPWLDWFNGKKPQQP